MVAIQTLLMNYFLLGLHSDQRYTNDVMQDYALNKTCPYGCYVCSPVNGCLACKLPYYLLLQRENFVQTTTCTRVCPAGFFKSRKKSYGYCAKCLMKGCEICSSRHSCSKCSGALVNSFGKCRKKCPPQTSLNNAYHYCEPMAENELVVAWPNGTSIIEVVTSEKERKEDDFRSKRKRKKKQKKKGRRKQHNKENSMKRRWRKEKRRHRRKKCKYIKSEIKRRRCKRRSKMMQLMQR